MEILAKLYKCAEERLGVGASVGRGRGRALAGGGRIGAQTSAQTGTETRSGISAAQWAAFAADFHQLFGAHIALYTTRFGPDGREVKRFSIIASSDPATTDAYAEQEIYRHLHIPESALAPLEPARRSDEISDAEFEKLGVVAEFMIAAGMYYLISVPAMLGDGAITTLTAWRARTHGDFSDLDKQRLALFMRHLMALVGQEALVLEKPRPDVEAFGLKWGLTRAETELLAALLRGMSLRAVAEQSGRSYGTIRWHMQNILSKCQVGSQKDLLREFYTLIKR